MADELTYPVILDLDKTNYDQLVAVADSYDLDIKDVLFACINITMTFHAEEAVMLLTMVQQQQMQDRENS